MIARWTFDSAGSSIGDARRFAAAMAADLPAELQQSVALMVSELSTNALVHASSGFEMTIERSSEVLRVTVTDSGEGTPALQSPTASEPHGRGLRIVEVLSDDWGIAYAPERGKTVWFRMDLADHEADGPHHAADGGHLAVGDDRRRTNSDARG